MREVRDCVICRKKWYRGDTPPCSHSDEEWAAFRRGQSEPEAANRHQKRKALKLARARL